jgi:hypothetical protein
MLKMILQYEGGGITRTLEEAKTTEGDGSGTNIEIEA